MKKLLSILALAILSLQAYSQAHNPLWCTKIRKTCFYGIAKTPVPIYDIAASDAKKVGVVSIYDSVNFIHQMNGYWYVLTDKGGNGYVKNLRYRPIDIDSIKNAEKYRLLAIKEAKEKAARDSAIAAERRLLAYTSFDSATAEQLLQSKLWEGMTPEMAEIAIGEPIHELSPMANGSTFETWEYKDKCLYFNGGCLEVYEDIVEIPLPEKPVYADNNNSETPLKPLADIPAAPATDALPGSSPAALPAGASPQPVPVTPDANASPPAEETPVSEAQPETKPAGNPPGQIPATTGAEP